MAILESSNPGRRGCRGGARGSKGTLAGKCHLGSGHIIVGTDRLQPYHHVALGDDFWGTSGNEFTGYHVIKFPPAPNAAVEAKASSYSRYMFS